MTVYTTLKALREQSACIRGYNRLAYYLKGEPYQERDTYLRFRLEAQIPLAIILQSNDLDDAVWSLRAVKQTPELVRDCRLFAVACARQVQHLMLDLRSLTALDVAERYANGLATDGELVAAGNDASDAAWTTSDDIWGAPWCDSWSDPRTAARTAIWTTINPAWRAAEKVARATQYAGVSTKEAPVKLFKQFFCGE